MLAPVATAASSPGAGAEVTAGVEANADADVDADVDGMPCTAADEDTGDRGGFGSRRGRKRDRTSTCPSGDAGRSSTIMDVRGVDDSHGPCADRLSGARAWIGGAPWPDMRAPALVGCVDMEDVGGASVSDAPGGAGAVHASAKESRMYGSIATANGAA